MSFGVEIWATRTLKEMVSLKQQYLQAVVTHPANDRGGSSEQILNRANDGTIADAFFDSSVCGKDYPDIITKFTKRKRQGAGHVGEPSGLYQRIDLGAYKENVHAGAGATSAGRMIVPWQQRRCHPRTHRIVRDRRHDRYRSAYLREHSRSCRECNGVAVPQARLARPASGSSR